MSLPRVERISNQMVWESGALYNKYHWASPKFFVFFRVFAQFLFRYPRAFYQPLWSAKPKNLLSAYSTSSSGRFSGEVYKSRADYFHPQYFDTEQPERVVISNVYLYQLLGKNIVFFICLPPADVFIRPLVITPEPTMLPTYLEL